MPILSSKRWLIQPPHPKQQVAISNALHIHPIVAQLLVNRGIETIEEARQFLFSEISSLHDAFLLKDMEKAVARIKKARDAQELVLIYGDYDVDGVASSAILNQILRRFGVKVMHFIPHRIHDGYGLNHDVAILAKETGVALLIAIDCGITAHSEVDNLNQNGIDVIIFDHHEPSHHGLPLAHAIVNPKRKDCSYPFKHLASVGLAAKLTQALLRGQSPNGDSPLNLEEVLDLVAMGTIADVVPLRGENRTFVKLGLPKIMTTQNKGLQALLDVAKIKGKEIKPYYVGFILGPRINATGRMDSAQKSLELFLSDDIDQAYALAKSLEEHNTQRQKMQKDVVQEALNMVEQEINFKDHKVIVVSKEGWHKGVLGIVASRITETYYRPTIVISLDNGIGSASARSIDGFHLYDALTHCSEILETFGGHKLAAGLTIKSDNIARFREMINEFAHENFQEENLIPTIKIDCEIPLSAIDMKLVEVVDSLEPYGEGNPQPLFCSRQVTVKTPPMVLGKDTLKFWISDGKTTLSAVGFGMAKYRDMVSVGAKIDIVYQLSIDDWNKEPIVQLKLKDLK